MNNDLISRETLLNEFDSKCKRTCPTCEYYKWNSKLNRHECKLINTAPTVETPQAEWLYFEGVSTSGYLECSKCGETDFHKRYSNFCPNCGAKMTSNSPK